MMATLPQLESTYLSDGGLETDLIFNHGIDLPEFAAFPLTQSETGRTALRTYYEAYLDIARRDGVGIVLETPTWRANSHWASLLGYSTEGLAEANHQAVGFVRDLDMRGVDVVVSGNVGPAGDSYVIAESLTTDQAAAYHRPQITSLAAAGADMIGGLTLTYAEEAIGMVRSAADADIPIMIGFTVETDGNLPSGQPLAEAITQVDNATDSATSYYMVNCAHPSHFHHVSTQPGPWERLQGIRCNASESSHAELDEATELDRGNIEDLAARSVQLRDVLPHLAVVGGCCGTDSEHIDAISTALLTASQ
ncbi:MAG: homocysteine S-methyltransferase family protein [Ornithinimicrobium sp.]